MELLVIDNDRTCRDAICFLVEAEGHSAEGTMWGNEVWSRLDQKEFDAVLLDLDLGSANGLHLLAEFRATRPGLPVVLVAAELTSRIAEEAMCHGALDLLEKPFEREHLITVLARLQRFQQLEPHRTVGTPPQRRVPVSIRAGGQEPL